MSENLQPVLNLWREHYESRLGECSIELVENENGIHTQCMLTSPLIKKGNSPRIFYHGQSTNDVIVLTHGLSDSPWYLLGVARRFYNLGLNVILPLLPAHGLVDPEKAMEDKSMDSKWRLEIDRAVYLAERLGNRISLGGFSTGGALSYNKILRDSVSVTGGLFLFAGALDIGTVNEFVSKIGLVQKLLKREKIEGIGQDPFKYPDFPKFGAVELAQIIDENKDLEKNKKISQPVFAAHSINDESAKLDGIIDLLNNHVEIGSAYIISQNLRHPETTLEIDVPLDTSKKHAPDKPPKANPQFDQMMAAALHFFKNNVLGGSN